MQTIGEKLLEARQRQGISIREAAEYTKVRGEFIDAMESNQFERIGLADVYKRGFLKIYAKFLRLDPDRIVNEYNSLSQVHASGSPTSRRLQREVFGRMDADAAEKNVIAGVTDEKMDNEFTSSALEAANRPGVDRKKFIRYGLISIGALVVVLILMELVSCGDKKPAAVTPPASSASVASPQYTVKVIVYEATKVSIEQKGDGKIVFNELVHPDSPKEIVVQGDILISSTKIKSVSVQVENQLYRSTNDFAPGFILEYKTILSARSVPHQ